VVRKGDTLWSLAEEYLGSGRRWQEIAEANPSVNPNKLLVGMQLKIPPK
jgi:5'-nucleotidase